jgi:hypothetical protein
MTRPRGFSLVGMLITLVCIVVLFAIGMSAMNKAITGAGSAVDGTVRSMEDKFALYALYQSMLANAGDHRGRFPTPSVIRAGGGRDGDVSHDTTASLFSYMVMHRYVAPEQLISGNEYSGYVEVDDDYDFLVYDPGADVFWDPAFMADLAFLSNTSYAHMPLCGTRHERRWQSNFSSRFPLIGNRGPKDGVEDPESWSVGRSGIWGGHVLYGDAHIEFLDTFTPGSTFFERDGQRYPDNIFAMEDGPLGADAILSFTKSMTADGPELQHD